jgi:hypothetical protein
MPSEGHSVYLSCRNVFLLLHGGQRSMASHAVGIGAGAGMHSPTTTSTTFRFIPRICAANPHPVRPGYRYVGNPVGSAYQSGFDTITGPASRSTCQNRWCRSDRFRSSGVGVFTGGTNTFSTTTRPLARRLANRQSSAYVPKATRTVPRSETVVAGVTCPAARVTRAPLTARPSASATGNALPGRASSLTSEPQAQDVLPTNRGRPRVGKASAVQSPGDEIAGRTTSRLGVVEQTSGFRNLRITTDCG